MNKSQTKSCNWEGKICIMLLDIQFATYISNVYLPTHANTVLALYINLFCISKESMIITSGINKLSDKNLEYINELSILVIR